MIVLFVVHSNYAYIWKFRGRAITWLLPWLRVCIQYYMPFCLFTAC